MLVTPDLAYPLRDVLGAWLETREKMVRRFLDFLFSSPEHTT